MNNKNLHILQVVGTMNRGGAEVMLMDIYRNISPHIHFDFLINYKAKTGVIKGDFDDEIILKGGSVNHIQTQWDLGPVQYINEFKSICQKIGVPDVVHIHLNSRSGIIAFAARQAGVKKIIVHSHADLKFRGSFLTILANKAELFIQKHFIEKYATDFWGASIEANKSLFKNSVINKSIVINNAIDIDNFINFDKTSTSIFRDGLNIKTNTLLLGNIGRIVRHKNGLFVIKVLDELNKHNIDFMFIFAGRADDETYMQEINDKIDACNLSEKVIYLGLRSDIPLIMSSLDVFIGPALKEGFGLVAIEAQAAGVPCALYNGFPRSVDMKLGLVSFLSSFDCEEWITTILSIKDNKNRDKGAITLAIKNRGFDVKTNTKLIEDFYAK